MEKERRKRSRAQRNTALRHRSFITPLQVIERKARGRERNEDKEEEDKEYIQETEGREKRESDANVASFPRRFAVAAVTNRMTT